MEFETRKQKKDVFKIISIIYFIGAVLMFWENHIDTKHYHLYMPYNLKNYILVALLIYIFGIIPITFLIGRYKEKIVIQFGRIHFYRKYLSSFKEVSSINISDIECIRISKTINLGDNELYYDKNEPKYLSGYRSIIDKLGKNKMTISQDLFNSEGKEFFNYLESQGIKTREKVSYEPQIIAFGTVIVSAIFLYVIYLLIK